MEYVLNHPWELALLLGIVLAFVLDLGRRAAVRYQIEQAPPTKRADGHHPRWAFYTTQPALGIQPDHGGLSLCRAPLFAGGRSHFDWHHIPRTSTLPQPYRDHSKQLLEQYVDTRLELDNVGVNANRFVAAVNRAKRLQEDLWLDAATVAQNDRTAITAVYLNSLNENIDLHEKRVAAFENRIPQPVGLLIISVSLIAVFTRGSTLTARFWLTLILVPITIAIVIALIADLDTPSGGLIRLDQRACNASKPT